MAIINIAWSGTATEAGLACDSSTCGFLLFYHVMCICSCIYLHFLLHLLFSFSLLQWGISYPLLGYGFLVIWWEPMIYFHKAIWALHLFCRTSFVCFVLSTFVLKVLAYYITSITELADFFENYQIHTKFHCQIKSIIEHVQDSCPEQFVSKVACSLESYCFFFTWNYLCICYLMNVFLSEGHFSFLLLGCHHFSKAVYLTWHYTAL